MENTQKSYMKGFVPYAIAAAVLSLCGGFTASVPTAISTAWNTDASLTFITLAYSLAAATGSLHTVALVQLVCVAIGIVVCFLLPTVRAKAPAKEA